MFTIHEATKRPCHPSRRPRSPDRRWRVGGRSVAAVVLSAVLVVSCSSGSGGSSGGDGGSEGASGGDPTAIEGVVSFADLTRNHVDGQVDYPQTPPVGGDHAPAWQNCGTYLEPIPNETGVHSMEHGAVWITYRPDLPAPQVAQLQELGRTQPYVVVSPFDGLPSPLVLTAWGKQLQLTSADDDRVDEFITAYRQGPQTPEPGAICTNGTGVPQ